MLVRKCNSFAHFAQVYHPCSWVFLLGFSIASTFRRRWEIENHMGL